MNCKVLNISGLEQKLDIYYLISGKVANSISLTIPADKYFETIVELPISSYTLKRKKYTIQLDVKVNNVAVYGKQSPYKIKLVNYQRLDQIKLPNKVLINTNKFDYSESIHSIKHFIVTVPHIGPIINKTYQVLRTIKK